MKERPVALPRNPGEPLFVQRQKCRGDRAQGEVREVSCQLGNRREKALTDSAATAQRGFYCSVTSSRPSSLHSQHCGGLFSPASRAQAQTHTGPTPWQHRLQGCLAYLPQYRDSRGPAKKRRGVCACVCVRGAQSNTSLKPRPRESGHACCWQRRCSSVCGGGQGGRKSWKRCAAAVLQHQGQAAEQLREAGKLCPAASFSPQVLPTPPPPSKPCTTGLKSS